MKKTLLLVFIHGFKGSDDTFGHFPKDLCALLSHALPKLNVVSLTYPRYETRGDLHDCVARFKEWLQNRVIDLEVANKTPSPTIDPSVRVVLVGHSMGGIVAAETLISIAKDQPAPRITSSTPPPGVGNSTAGTTSTSNPQSTNNSTANLSIPANPTRASSAPPDSSSKNRPGTPQPPSSDPGDDSGEPPAFLFPFVQAVIAFDTPYLGIHPGVVAHNAETYYNTGSAAWNAYNQASRFFGTGQASTAASAASAAQQMDAAKALPAPGAGGNGSWGNWGKWAMYAGGAAAVAAAGGAAWMGRQHITEGWSWVGSHLEFVGCLARGAELASRVDSVVHLSRRHGVGFADFYTCLGSAVRRETHYAGQVVGEERTFCVVPKEVKDAEKESSGPFAKKRKKMDAVDAKGAKGTWVKCVNEMAQNEIRAHQTIFLPAENPGYFAMNERAKEMIVAWVDKAWYESPLVQGEGEVEEGAGEDEEAGEGEDMRLGNEDEGGDGDGDGDRVDEEMTV